MTRYAGNLALAKGEVAGYCGAHRVRDGDIRRVAQVSWIAVMATAANLVIIPEMESHRYGTIESYLMAERAVLGLMVNIRGLGEARQGDGGICRGRGKPRRGGGEIHRRGDRNEFGRLAGWERWPEEENPGADPG